MERAKNLFVFDEAITGSPFVERIWRTRSVADSHFISVAVPHWLLVVTKERDSTYVTLRGPETRATISPIPQGAEFIGVQFKLGVFMSKVSIDRLVDNAVSLQRPTEDSFRLGGRTWELPDYDNADVFVERLVRSGLLLRDPLVAAALAGHVKHLSLRTIQRRVVRATGLTPGAIRQMKRANRAAELLEKGTSISDTVEMTGYADQAHLSRSLSRFLGQTSRRIKPTTS